MIPSSATFLNLGSKRRSVNKCVQVRCIHGNNEFRENVRKAHEEHKTVRLVIVKTDQVERVEAGEDASKVKKEFFVRDDLVGEVVEIDNDRYVFRFRRS